MNETGAAPADVQPRRRAVAPAAPDTGGDVGDTPAVDDRIVVWGLAGCLGDDSPNRRLLRAIAALAPSGIQVQICELLPHLPLFDEELIDCAPPAVCNLRAEIAAADALLVATKDLNGGIPGVLKNALDWLSVPGSRPAVRGRPVALVGAFADEIATVRCQTDLRSIFTSLDAPVLRPPWLLLDHAAERMGDNDQLDADLIAQVEQLFRRLRQSVRGSRRDRGVHAGAVELGVTGASSVPPPDSFEPEEVSTRARQRREVLAFLRANLDRSSLDVGQVARACCMSTRTLQRLFTSAELALDLAQGAPPRGVMNTLRALRVEHAAGLLRTEPTRPIRWVLRESGFCSPSTFHRTFREFTGMTPSEYRQQWAQPGEEP